MAYSPEKAREYYLRNKERVKARVAEYRKNNPEKAKAAVLAWYAKPENKAKRNEYFKTYSKTEPFLRAQENYRSKPDVIEKKHVYEKSWREQNRDKVCNKENRRRAAKLQRVPCWQS